MTTAVTILHISDLHERAPFDGMPAGRAARLDWDAEERAKLLGTRFRAALAEFAGKVDLVCLTGDVADWGHPAEYAAATKRVADILAAVDVPFDRFFAVPGNHDVQRRVEEDAWRTIRAWHASARDTGTLGRWFRQAGDPPFGIDGGMRARVLQRTSAFWDWMGSLGRGELRPVAPKLLGFRSTLEGVRGPGLPVHIVGLDSAWLCGGDDDQGRIVITAEQAQAHLFDRGAMLRGVRIALVHHPLEHLADGHEVRRVLADAGTDLLLHGHQHVVTSLRTDENDARLRVLAAGCLVEGDLGHRWPNGFQLIELDVAQRSGRVSFRKWSQDGRFWAKGCDVYRDAPDGSLEWHHEHVEDHADARAPAPPVPGAAPAAVSVTRRRAVIDPSVVFALMTTGGADGRLVGEVMRTCARYEQLVFELVMGFSEYVGMMRALSRAHEAAMRFRDLPQTVVETALEALEETVQKRLEQAVEQTARDPDAIVAMAGQARPPAEQLAYVARLFALAEAVDGDLLVRDTRAVVARRLAAYLGGWSLVAADGPVVAFWRDAAPP